jgi:hypothetical protein
VSAEKAAAEKIDAVLIPRHYPRGAGDRHEALRAEFGPVLGVERVHTRHCGTSESLVTAAAEDHRYFGITHPLAGQDRYTWQDRGDGVRYGTLRPEARA